MEADLQRFYGLDYRDRWTGDLTLRRLLVLIRHLPEESALTAALSDGMRWSLEAHLLDDLRMWLTTTKKHQAKPHPSRPSGNQKRLNPAAIAAGRRRRSLRLHAIEAGEIT